MDSPDAGSTGSSGWLSVLRFLRTHWVWVVGLVGYGTFALVTLRGDFGGGGSLPQGTNALNTYTIYVFQQRYGATTWLAPFTDWGQPNPYYPGLDPSNLIAYAQLLGPTQFIRASEFVGFLGAGLSMCWAVLRLGGRPGPALVAGAFYMLLAQTPEFFEGHIPFMLSLALGPVFFVLVYLFFRGPTLRHGLALALVLFLLATVGDLGCLYRFLFFGLPMAGLLVVLRFRDHPYGRREIAAIGFGLGLFLLLLLPWAVTSLAGVNPQFTTGITVTTAAFAQTGGQSLYLAFMGFIADHSYTILIYHQQTYAYAFSLTGPLFLLLPVAVGAYAVWFGRRLELLLYLSGLVAMLFSTGTEYPGVSSLNQWFYTHIPYFSSDDALFHWNIYYVLVLGLLLGFGLSRFEGWVEQARLPATRPGTTPGPRSPPRPNWWTSGGGTSRGLRPPFAAERRRAAMVLVVGVLLVSTALPLVQNWEDVSRPVGTFQYPSAYTTGFQYVATQPDLGGVLSVPFGNIYERTPWGGVSLSSQLYGGSVLDRNLNIFEAGTPYSLRLDLQVGDGLNGYTNNLSKLLAATNTQFVVGTQYPNWDQASDALYNPIIQYEGLLAQRGLGAPVEPGGYETVYPVPDPAGNLSVFSQYYIYDGGESLVNEILDQPWYNGTQALVAWGDVQGKDASVLLEHAAAFIATPSALANLTAADWAALRAGPTPIWGLLSNPDFAPDTIQQYTNYWNASNARDFGARYSDTPLVSHAFAPSLVSEGYDVANVTLRVAGPPGARFTLEAPSDTDFNGTVGEPVAPVADLPYGNSSVVSAGSNPRDPLPSNGTLAWNSADGTTYLAWSPGPNNSTYMALDFAYQNLSRYQGISLTLNGPPLNASALELQLVLSQATLTVPGYVSNVSTDGSATTYSFYFRDAIAPASAPIGFNPANITASLKDLRHFVVVLPTTDHRSSYIWSNLTAFDNQANGFYLISTGSHPVDPSAPWTISTSPLVRFDTLVAQMGPTVPATPPRQDVYAAQSSVVDQQATLAGSGWSVVQLGQTYSSAWTLQGPLDFQDHLVVNVGLNGWLVDASGPVVVHVVYTGNVSALWGSVGEGIGLVGFVAAVVVYRRWPLPGHGFRRTRPSPGPTD